MVKTYNCKYDRAWYVHISRWKGINGAHLLFRGDSDPVIMYNGRFVGLDFLYDYLEDMYSDYTASLDDGEKPMSLEDFCDDNYLNEYAIGMVFDALENDRYVYRNNTYDKNMAKDKLSWRDVDNLTPEEQTIKDLQSKLSDCTLMLDNLKCLVVDGEWDAHHCGFYTVNETVGDYQVVRKFDIEVEPVDPLDRATEEELKEYEEESEKSNGFYDEVFERICDRLSDEYGDPFYMYDCGEVAQTWINVKTGNVIRLGKVDDYDPHNCNFDVPWEVISNKHCNKLAQPEDVARAEAFSHTFFESYLDPEFTHHSDLSIHPLLLQRGYKMIEATDYAPLDVRYEYSDISFDSRLYLSLVGQYSIEEVIQSFVSGGEKERLIKMWMADRELLILREKIKTEYREQFDTAIKIVARKHYNIEDKSMYADMFNAMCELGKDIHNPFYVCPTDFKDMHDKMVKSLDRQRKKIEEQRRKEQMKRDLEKAREYQEYYDVLVNKFGNVHIKNDKYDIFLCPSINAMADEGEAMHHCVFANGYYKPEHNCLILLCRDANDINKRISTIEVSKKTWSIVQNRAVCNGVPDGLDEINSLVNSNMSLFKKANKKTKEIIVKQAA